MESFKNIKKYSVIALLLSMLSCAVQIDAMRPIDENLFDMVKKDNVAAVTHLLNQEGANANAQNTNSRNKTPLFFVKSPKMATVLLEHGANIDQRDITGDTPLLNLCQNLAFEIDLSNIISLEQTINLLIQKGADIEATDSTGQTISASLSHILAESPTADWELNYDARQAIERILATLAKTKLAQEQEQKLWWQGWEAGEGKSELKEKLPISGVSELVEGYLGKEVPKRSAKPTKAAPAVEEEEKEREAMTAEQTEQTTTPPATLSSESPAETPASTPSRSRRKKIMRFLDGKPSGSAEVENLLALRTNELRSALDTLKQDPQASLENIQKIQQEAESTLVHSQESVSKYPLLAPVYLQMQMRLVLIIQEAKDMIDRQLDLQRYERERREAQRKPWQVTEADRLNFETQQLLKQIENEYGKK